MEILFNIRFILEPYSYLKDTRVQTIDILFNIRFILEPYSYLKDTRIQSLEIIFTIRFIYKYLSKNDFLIFELRYLKKITQSKFKPTFDC